MVDGDGVCDSGDGGSDGGGEGMELVEGGLEADPLGLVQRRGVCCLGEKEGALGVREEIADGVSGGGVRVQVGADAGRRGRAEMGRAAARAGGDAGVGVAAAQNGEGWSQAGQSCWCRTEVCRRERKLLRPCLQMLPREWWYVMVGGLRFCGRDFLHRLRDMHYRCGCGSREEANDRGVDEADERTTRRQTTERYFFFR